MALKKETTERLKTLGIDVAALVKAHTDEKEVDFAAPEGQLFTDAEIATRDTSNIAAGKKEGEKEAKSIFVKELGKKLSIDLKGERISDLANEIGEFANKGADDKVKILQKQVADLTTDKQTLESKITDADGRIAAAQEDFELISYFPANRSNDISDTDRLMLLKRGITIKNVDGKKVVEKDGVVVTDDKTRAPKPLKDVIADEFKARPILLGTVTQGAATGAGGRGAGDAGGAAAAGAGGKPKKFSQAIDVWKKLDPEKNTNEMSQEFTEYVAAIAKDDPEFKMYD